MPFHGAGCGTSGFSLALVTIHCSGASGRCEHAHATIINAVSASLRRWTRIGAFISGGLPRDHAGEIGNRFAQHVFERAFEDIGVDGVGGFESDVLFKSSAINTFHESG